ncbi:MAG TPA: hypothetical protein VHW09_18130 [Bryobacteraceae bacterium]|jgi:hypothetical protein|nr:hypothetical protein [Bryobacteraceae bacterium]
MTIDERIEALTQSLELLSGMHRELQKQTAATTAATLAATEQTAAATAAALAATEQTAAALAATGDRLDRLTALTEALAGGILAHDNQIGTLVSIAAKHEATLRGPRE